MTFNCSQCTPSLHESAVKRADPVVKAFFSKISSRMLTTHVMLGSGLIGVIWLIYIGGLVLGGGVRGLAPSSITSYNTALRLLLLLLHLQ